jgi:ABC-2 type transport system ATP-binding protein
MSEGRIVADDAVATLLRGGGTQRYRITSPDLDDVALAGLAARFDVADVVHGDGTTRVEVAVDSDGFYALVDYLREHDVTLDAVNTVSHDLERVFVELTGRGRQ